MTETNSIDRPDCPNCDGSGALGGTLLVGRRCPECHGRGWIVSEDTDDE